MGSDNVKLMYFSQISALLSLISNVATTLDSGKIPNPA